MKRVVLILVLAIILFARIIASAEALSVCTFNIQFLGSSTKRDDVGLADLLKKYDLIVVQELIAPPYSGNFPNGKPFVPDVESRHFFDCMLQEGFTYQLSEEDTGPGIRNHLNSSATEWWVAFYRTNKVKLAADLPSGFLSPVRAHNPDFDRVPYAFAFRTLDNQLDFVLISVHLEPGPGRLNKLRRKHELASIASWIGAHNRKEKDFIVLGDMNIENAAELTNATPAAYTSLNKKCDPTNTNVNAPKPYDHVLYVPSATGNEFDQQYGFHIVNLIEEMRTRWTKISKLKYPGGPVYNHNIFRQYYSDHDPVDFKLQPLTGGDHD